MVIRIQAGARIESVVTARHERAIGSRIAGADYLETCLPLQQLVAVSDLPAGAYIGAIIPPLPG